MTLAHSLIPQPPANSKIINASCVLQMLFYFTLAVFVTNAVHASSPPPPSAKSMCNLFTNKFPAGLCQCVDNSEAMTLSCEVKMASYVDMGARVTVAPCDSQPYVKLEYKDNLESTADWKLAKEVQYGNAMTKFPIPGLGFGLPEDIASVDVEAEIKLTGSLISTDLDIAIGGCAKIGEDKLCDNNICVTTAIGTECISKCVLPLASRVMSLHD